MTRLALLPLAAAALIAAGCGEEAADGSGNTAAAGGKARGTRVKVVGSDFGRVLADRRGEAFYLFGRDRRRSTCQGACAKAWPPVITSGSPVAVGGVKKRLLGATRRKNGKLQVTYAGHPLYYYVHDSPGNILCQDVVEFGGRWLVVKPSGRPVG